MCIRDRAMAIPGTSFESEYFSKFRKVQDTTTSGAVWKWMSFTKVVDIFGLAAASEQVNTGVLTARKYSWINDDTTSLSWPETHEFKVSIEQGSQMRAKIEGMQEKTGPVEGDAEAFDAALQKNAPEGPPSKKNNRNPQPKEKTEGKVVLAELKVPKLRLKVSNFCLLYTSDAADE